MPCAGRYFSFLILLICLESPKEQRDYGSEFSGLGEVLSRVAEASKETVNIVTLLLSSVVFASISGTPFGIPPMIQNCEGVERV